MSSCSWADVAAEQYPLVCLLPACCISVAETSQKFHLFPELAAELRIKIWKFAAQQQPRAIEFVDDNPNANYRALYQKGMYAPWDHVTAESKQVPALLQVNHEAREEALKIYEKRTVDCDHGVTERYIYFNPETDCIRLAQDAFSVLTLDMMLVYAAGIPIPRVIITGQCGGHVSTCLFVGIEISRSSFEGLLSSGWIFRTDQQPDIFRVGFTYLVGKTLSRDMPVTACIFGTMKGVQMFKHTIEYKPMIIEG
jgi:hypothetical protein